jgi:D-alanyl-D-alanine carboxypeptidase/D-alanyl-D-alanine-endopeptidase (penicillin-binding protein 4)
VGNYSANPTALTRYGSYSSDSAGDTARYFRKQLKTAGVRTSYGVTRQTAPADADLVAEFTDHTVADAIWPMLKFSDNTIAEVMIRHIARARGTDTTTTGSAAALRAELARLGIPVGNMRPVDGSGLSRGNRISASTLVAITRASVNPADPGLSAGFRYSAFPVSGISGTLESRFKSRQTSCAAGRIMAKTGTLSDTIALSGVTGSTDGRPRAFAIMVNSKPSWASLDSARFRVDRIAAAINGCR